MKMNLRNRFLVPMLLLIILGMGTSTAVSYFKAKDALEEEITARLEQITDSTVKVIDAWVKDQELNVSNWSRQKMYMTAVKDSFIGKAARKSASSELEKVKKDYKYYEEYLCGRQGGRTCCSFQPKNRRQNKVKDRGLF